MQVLARVRVQGSYRYCRGLGFMQVLARVSVQGSYRYCRGLGFMQVPGLAGWNRCEVEPPPVPLPPTKTSKSRKLLDT